ncbi:MAG: hypothetical protein WDO16_16745 [Bacteroidota bacterium]
MKSVIFLLAFIPVALAAQNIDTVHAGDGKLNLKYLPAGTQRYLVYIKNKEGQKKNIWLGKELLLPNNGKAGRLY